MKKEEFIEVLKHKKYAYKIQGDNIIVTYYWSVDLNTLKTIPPGVEFINDGDAFLGSLETIPPCVEFKNGGSVHLGDLKTLPPGVEFSNSVNIYFRSLKTLPPGVEFRNGGNVFLSSLEVIPPGVEFRNGGDVYLGGILGGWLNRWEGNIEGVGSKRLLNLMANKGLFL